MSSTIKLLGSVVITACLVGCDSVGVKQPLGQPTDEAGRAKLIGIWQLGDANQFHVQQKRDGSLAVGVLEWNKATEEFRAGGGDLVVTHLGQTQWMFMRNSQKREEGWTFVSYEHDGQNGLKLFACRPQVFQEAVKAGQLEGTISKQGKRSHTLITSSKADVERFISDSGSSKLFLDNSIELERVGKN